MKYSMTLIGVILMHLTFGQAKSKTDTLQSGELMLKQEIVINTSVDNVWKAFTEAEHWKKWATRSGNGFQN